MHATANDLLVLLLLLDGVFSVAVTYAEDISDVLSELVSSLVSDGSSVDLNVIHCKRV